jgi:Amt family ammonium transporter
VLSVIGAGLLWVGWFGFNAGSALSAGGLAASAFVATHFAASAGAIGWVAMEWIKTGKATVLGAISGAVAGLVVITPASGFTTGMYGMLMGLIGGIACYWAATALKSKLGYDDALDAFGVHGVGGTVGALLTGIFAVAAINGKSGWIEGNRAQFVDQLTATGVTCLVAIVGSLVLLKVTDWICNGLRVDELQEIEGLDRSLHGEAGYEMDEAGESASLAEEPTSATAEAAMAFSAAS